MELIELSEHRAPVNYTVRITHHWDGQLEVFIDDVSDDDRSRASVMDALQRICGFSEVLSALKDVVGLIQLIAGRDDLPADLRLKSNHRYVEAMRVLGISANAETASAGEIRADTYDANARIMAASKDMLAALKAALAWRDGLRNTDMPIVEFPEQAIRTAIAKALAS